MAAPAPTPEQMNEARVRRMRVQLQRLTAALLAEASTPWVDAGIAESPEGKADILETKEETGRTLRLFIDQATHLPLMVQYQDPKPMDDQRRSRSRRPRRSRWSRRWPGGPGGPPPTPEQVQQRVAEMQRTPPPLGTFAMHLSDYKKVDGIMLPHRSKPRSTASRMRMDDREVQGESADQGRHVGEEIIDRRSQMSHC